MGPGSRRAAICGAEMVSQALDAPTDETSGDVPRRRVHQQFYSARLRMPQAAKSRGPQRPRLRPDLARFSPASAERRAGMTRRPKTGQVARGIRPDGGQGETL